MTSDAQIGRCFVYITPPGETQSVTAGRFELSTDRRGTPLGRFVYGRRYLERPDCVEIDPVELKIAGRVYETAALNGIFGALRDAGPDYWGRLVIERHAGKPRLGELDYLLLAPDDRAGALGLGLGQDAPAPRRNFNQTINLARLQEIATAILNDLGPLADSATYQVQDLLLIGTSMGGARPKTVVEDSQALWLAKFNRPDDRWNSARVEHAMLVLGRTCGLATANSQVVSAGGREVLLIKRFDRERTDRGYLRARMVSALTLLRADESPGSDRKWSYVLLAEELRRVSVEPRKDAAELFRRMCFNALISNADDHPRNHAIVAWKRDWNLSPAYDLTPTSPVSLERRDLAMSCGDLGRLASAENLLSQSTRFLLPRPEAEAILSEMERRVQASWHAVARSESVSERDCGLIAGAFVYPGFRLKSLRTEG